MLFRSTAFQVTNKYELPVASGMKLTLTGTGNGYELKLSEVDGAAIQDDAVYKILLSTEFNSLFARVLPDRPAPERLGVHLATAWTNLMSGGGLLAASEEYIEIIQ